MVPGRSGISTRFEMAVPLSPDELMRKRRCGVHSINRTKDSAMFPGKR